MTHQNQRDCRDSGFTLVELAIVMIIIGLLIGGILKGQELIANAQVAATVAQAKGVDAATSTFRDSYNALPGDINNASARLPGCAANTVCAAAVGNGDGIIGAAGTIFAAATAAGTENNRAWIHLNFADLVAGVDGSGNAVVGQGIPAAPSGGGLSIGFFAGGAALGLNPAARGGHYLFITTPANTSGALNASEAARIDRKMDDGAATSGSVFGQSVGAACNAGTDYDEANNPTSCDLAIRIQG